MKQISISELKQLKVPEKGLLDGRETQIEELRKEVRLLRWQINELSKVGV